MALQERRHIVPVVAAQVARLDVYALPWPLDQLGLQREIAVFDGNLEADAAARRMHEFAIGRAQEVCSEAKIPVIMPAVVDVQAATDVVDRRTNVVGARQGRRQ